MGVLFDAFVLKVVDEEETVDPGDKDNNRSDEEESTMRISLLRLIEHRRLSRQLCYQALQLNRRRRVDGCQC